VYSACMAIRDPETFGYSAASQRQCRLVEPSDATHFTWRFYTGPVTNEDAYAPLSQVTPDRPCLKHSLSTRDVSYS